MAAGMLVATSGSSSTTTTVPVTTVLYTCPAGAAYAVLHVSYTLGATINTNPGYGGSAYMAIQFDGVDFETGGASVPGGSPGGSSASGSSSGSTSIMLGPGETISVKTIPGVPQSGFGSQGSASFSYTVFASGYEG